MRAERWLTLVAVFTLATAAHADTPRSVDDLVGARASSGAAALNDRGWLHIQTQKSYDRSWSYWWNRDDSECISVAVADGRFDAITTTTASDCNQQGGGDNNNAAAIAIGAAAVLGAIALAHKHHHHDDDDHYDDQDDEAEFDRGYRDALHHRTYNNYDRTDAYREGFDSGTDQREHETSYRYHQEEYGRDYSNHYSRTVNLADLDGTRASSADSEMRERGFTHVDTLKSGNTSYGIWYNRRSGQCMQLGVADGRVVNVTDIHRHPGCH
ncbi:hypothetical protein F3N42_05330 [Marinihelvus fidelis]|uniref:PepSY domain-containing protein n=1 Tax=Marinihelvus fidelis TaxID=2613842 RepID=A0A5N0TD11_9GAMM|nr:hypothetical protein [Marinihelvus fidelis]KAA9132641.1 hypothetical protein F3N42_05330 [Marinihelvus fidelis]